MTRIRDMKECPKCGTDWKYKHKGEDYSRLIGVEIPMLYDGVSFWECPSCKATWDRWTDEEVDELPKRY